MANLVNLESVTKSYGERTLLDQVSLGVHDGDRIGVVGLNGSGKTTLLEVLTATVPPDAGRVSQARNLRVRLVTQRTAVAEGTVGQAVLPEYTAEYEWAGDPRIRSIMNGLGIPALGLDTSTTELSGGERRRVALATALVTELDLVVLDEPTNHLDIEGVRWLADHLHERKISLVVVTHDRWFLDTVCDRTWEVVDGGVEQYEGGYADWVYARAERARIAAATEEKRRNLARKELAWLQRGAKARTTKPRYRREAAEALIADVPQPRNTVELMSFAQHRLGKTVLELEDVSMATQQRVLLDHVTWHVGPGDRIGVVGVNGSGKTSLLRLLAGEREPEQGRRVAGKTVRPAYLRQELEDLPDTMDGAVPAVLSGNDQSGLRVLQAVEAVASHVRFGKQELSASQLTERLGFPPARQWTPVDDLSGGERRRLQLVRLLMSEPNVLLLDEPTNDLDVDTLQQLEDLLDSWAGTLVVVSHDRYLVERVCDDVVALFGDGQITHLPGGIDEYLQRRSQAAGRPGAPMREQQQTGKREQQTEQPKISAAQRRAASKELARIERRLEVVQKKEGELHSSLAAAATDPQRLRELDTELKTLLAEKSDLEERWLDTSETLE